MEQIVSFILSRAWNMIIQPSSRPCHRDLSTVDLANQGVGDGSVGRCGTLYCGRSASRHRHSHDLLAGLQTEYGGTRALRSTLGLVKPQDLFGPGTSINGRFSEMSSSRARINLTRRSFNRWRIQPKRYVTFGELAVYSITMMRITQDGRSLLYHSSICKI